MAVSYKVIRFQKNNTGTDGVTQDIDATFPPKGCIVISQNQHISNAFQDNFSFSIGYSDGTSNVCVAGVSDDASATEDNNNIYREDACLVRLDETTTTTIHDRATVSFPSGNTVRFTWTLNGTVSSWVTLIVFGGSDILNVKVGSALINNTTAVNEDFTPLSFTPVAGKAALFTLNGNQAASQSVPSTGVKLNWGCAVSSTKQWTKSVTITPASDPSATYVYANNTECMAMTLSASGAVQTTCEFVSWITNGFRLFLKDPPTSADRKFGYMVINGGTWDAGSDTISLTNTTKNHSVSVGGNTLRGVLMILPNRTIGWQAASTAATDNAMMACGTSDGTDEAYDATVDETAQATIDCYRMTGGSPTNSNCLVYLGSNGANTYMASFSSFGTNQFTLSYSATTGVADPFGWIVVADSPTIQNFNGDITESALTVDQTLARTLGAIRSPSESAISVSETLTRLFGALRPISEPSISSGETLTRILAALRSPTESAISVNQTLTGIRSVPRSISEPAITISETLARLLAATRPINETSISVNQTLARILGALRPITESSITSGETLIRLLAATRPITESAISINQTLTRLLGATRTITESSIAVNQTLTRLLGALRSISEPSITINDSITKSFSTLRTITESSLSVGETLTRLLGALRSIAETALTTDDSVTGVKETGGISITENAITVNDSVTRIQGLIKTITEGTITINQTLDRVLAALRTVSEPSISTNDSVTRLRETLRSISEDAITISDALVRIQNITKTINEDTDIDQTLQALLASYVIIVEAHIKWYYSLLTYKGGS
jgi:hypothetical protein